MDGGELPKFVLDILSLGPKHPVRDKFNELDFLADVEKLVRELRDNKTEGETLIEVWMNLFEVCSVVTLLLSFLISSSAFSNSRAKHYRSFTRAITSLVFVLTTFVTSSSSFFNISTCILQFSKQSFCLKQLVN